MSYFTKSQLRNFTDSKSLNESAGFIKESSIQADVSIFLSHSHKDTIYVDGVIKLFSSFKVNLYIDWKDVEMPDITNKETANKIKTRIKNDNYFLLLATENALSSRWVPWEIGVADGVKTNSQILILPVAENDGTYVKNEYLQLYRRIELSKLGQAAVFEPNVFTGILAETWLRSKN